MGMGDCEKTQGVKNTGDGSVFPGVDVCNDIVYTNNPHGYYGVQTFSQFSQGYIGSNGQIDNQLVFCIIPE